MCEWLSGSPTHPNPGAQAHVPTRIQTRDLCLCGIMTNQLSHTGQGFSSVLEPPIYAERVRPETRELSGEVAVQFLSASLLGSLPNSLSHLLCDLVPGSWWNTTPVISVHQLFLPSYCFHRFRFSVVFI